MENNFNQQNYELAVKAGTVFVKNPNLKPLLLTLIVVLFLSGFGMSVFAIWQGQRRERLYYETEGSLPVHKVRKSEVGDQKSGINIEGWKTYKNEQYGFEFKYPNDWIVKDFGEGWIIAIRKDLENSHREMMFSINTINVGRESVFDIASGVKVRDINFKGYEAKEYSCPEFNDCYSPDLAFSKAIKLVTFPKTWGQDNEIDYQILKGYDDLGPIYEGIILSFKFTDKTSSDGNSCIQVITTAENPATGEIREFPTPCDVPEGWEETTYSQNAGLQIYKNTVYKYQISFPGNSQLFSGVPTSGYHEVKALPSDAIYIEIKNGNSRVIICYVNDCGPGGIGDGHQTVEKTVTIDGKAYKASGLLYYNSTTRDQFLDIDLPNDIRISYGFNSEYGHPLSDQEVEEANKISEEILSTFKFTK